MIEAVAGLLPVFVPGHHPVDFVAHRGAAARFPGAPIRAFTVFDTIVGHVVNGCSGQVQGILAIDPIKGDIPAACVSESFGIVGRRIEAAVGKPGSDPSVARVVSNRYGWCDIHGTDGIAGGVDGALRKACGCSQGEEAAAMEALHGGEPFFRATIGRGGLMRKTVYRSPLLT